MEFAATQTKPASAGYKTLDFCLVRAGGLRLYSHGFNRQVQDVNLYETLGAVRIIKA